MRVLKDAGRRGPYRYVRLGLPQDVAERLERLEDASEACGFILPLQEALLERFVLLLDDVEADLHDSNTPAVKALDAPAPSVAVEILIATVPEPPIEPGPEEVTLTKQNDPAAEAPAGIAAPSPPPSPRPPPARATRRQRR